MFSVRTAFRAANSLSARTGLRSAAPIRSPASLGASAPARRSYHEKVIDHYSNPRNAGSLNRKDPNVGSGLVGAPACGDVIRLDIQVDEKTGNITEARFKTFGCGSAIASSSYLTTLLKGKSRKFGPYSYQNANALRSMKMILTSKIYSGRSR